MTRSAMTFQTIIMKIYNTLTKQKEDFIPRHDQKVQMFVCGPTVYDYIHIGNARTFVVFDTLAKYLQYRNYNVEYIQNITDIDDKIIAKANSTGTDPMKIAKDFEEKFYQDMKNIGVNAVSRYAPASEYINEVVRQVKVLLDTGHAYVIDDDGYYFDLKTFPEYGRLSGRTVEMAEDGVSRIDENSNKRNRGDFCLWKFSPPAGGSGEPSWDTELGKGRPGWHIEDTAITERHFGPQYDLHGAGQDLMFPHHEAEIAQQESASGLKPFVKYWMHVGFLVNKEQKMSKSLGNFMTLNEALKNYSPEALRFYFLSAHYRSSLDFSVEILKQAEAAVSRIGEIKNRISFHGSSGKKATEKEEKELNMIYNQIFEAMDDDFNTPKAIGHFFEIIHRLNVLIDDGIDINQPQSLTSIINFFDSVFGIIPAKIEIDPKIDKLVKTREKSRQAKDFQEADKLRSQIESFGYQIDDTSYGPLVKKR